MLEAQVRQVSAAIPVVRPGIARDTRESLDEFLDVGCDHDVLILSGGVSMGDLDLVGPELVRRGLAVLVEKVSIKPGKPLLFGRLPREGRRALHGVRAAGEPGVVVRHVRAVRAAVPAPPASGTTTSSPTSCAPTLDAARELKVIPRTQHLPAVLSAGADGTPARPSARVARIGRPARVRRRERDDRRRAGRRAAAARRPRPRRAARQPSHPVRAAAGASGMMKTFLRDLLLAAASRSRSGRGVPPARPLAARVDRDGSRVRPAHGPRSRDGAASASLGHRASTALHAALMAWTGRHRAAARVPRALARHPVLVAHGVPARARRRAGSGCRSCSPRRSRSCSSRSCATRPDRAQLGLDRLQPVAVARPRPARVGRAGPPRVARGAPRERRDRDGDRCAGAAAGSAGPRPRLLEPRLLAAASSSPPRGSPGTRSGRVTSSTARSRRACSRTSPSASACADADGPPREVLRDLLIHQDLLDAGARPRARPPRLVGDVVLPRRMSRSSRCRGSWDGRGRSRRRGRAGRQVRMRDLVLPGKDQVTILGLVRGKALPGGREGRRARRRRATACDETNVAWVVRGGVPTDVVYDEARPRAVRRVHPVPAGMAGARPREDDLIEKSVGYGSRT